MAAPIEHFLVAASVDTHPDTAALLMASDPVTEARYKTAELKSLCPAASPTPALNKIIFRNYTGMRQFVLSGVQALLELEP